MTAALMTVVGLEPDRVSPGETHISAEGGALSGARDGLDALSCWMDACPAALPADVRAGTMAMVGIAASDAVQYAFHLILARCSAIRLVPLAISSDTY